MSLWQFQTALNGFIEANTPRDSKTLSGDDFDELSHLLDQREGK